MLSYDLNGTENEALETLQIQWLCNVIYIFHTAHCANRTPMDTFHSIVNSPRMEINWQLEHFLLFHAVFGP